MRYKDEAHHFYEAYKAILLAWAHLDAVRNNTDQTGAKSYASSLKTELLRLVKDIRKKLPSITFADPSYFK